MIHNTPPASGGSTLEALPPDILRKIFHDNADDFFTQLQIELRLRLVCKSWRDHVVTRLFVSWTPLSSKNAINKAQLLVKLFPNMTTVNLIKVRDPVSLYALLKTLETVPLRSLSLFDI